MTIKIGTRRSRLALAQTEMLIKTLKNRFPNVEIKTVYISTTGDKTLDKPLAALGGKGVFIKELEMSLLSGETDVAVHSAKDLPTKIADGLEISAVLPRGSYGDVFQRSEHICELESDKFHIFLFHQVHDVLFGIILFG